jgi:hypothetical protein
MVSRNPTWQESPALARSFTPQQAPPGTYRAYTSGLSFEDALTDVKRDPLMTVWPGAWKVERQSPADVFGQGAGYNRWALALLYRATTPRVARGPRIEGGQTVEAWTLVSPYPNPAMDRLEPGTLLIVMKVR